MNEERGKTKTEELIIEAKNFFDFYKKDIGESIRKGKKTILLDFTKLIEFSNKLSEEILTNPEETLRMVEVAIEETGLVKNIRVRLVNVPKSQEIKVRNIRSKNLNEMIVIEGIIRQASDVRPQVVNAKFECPSCGTILSVLQIEKKFREPMRCSCGRKGGFKLISKDLVDTQRLVVEESPESLSGGEQPKRINVFLKEDLVEPKMEEKTTPGSRVKITGILKEVPVPLQSGGLSTRFELALEANNIIPMEETFEELDINEEDERQILELSQDPGVFEKLSKSIIPSVWGHDEIKRSLVLQLFGGVKKVHADGQKSRGDFHILLVGDPGVAKSATLVFMSGISPKGRYVVGKSTSGAGLTATVVRDEYLRGWSLEAGAMVLANKGLVCFTGDTKIALADGRNLSFIELIKEYKQGKINFTFTIDKNKLIKIAKIKNPRKTGYSEIMKVILDNGEEIKCTLNHKFMLRDGNYKEAQYLQSNDSLMPLYFKEAKKSLSLPILIKNTNHKVIKTEFLKEFSDVYDLTIDNTHNFALSAGIFVHNCIDELEKMDPNDRSAMHEAMEQQSITISKANVQACYSEDTEVLTEAGWKKYYEVGNLKIAQYNIEEDILKFFPHKGLYVYDFKGEAYHFKDKRNDILVTPNHTMLIKREKQNKFEKINAEDIASHRFKIKNSADFIGDGSDFFTLPAIKHKQNRIHPKYTHQHKEKKMPMNLWLEFLGYYVTEGGVETRPTIGIVQNKGPKADKIQKCLRKFCDILGCALSEIDCGKYWRFKITQTQLYEFIKNCGEKCYLKKTGLNFSKLSKEQLNILFNSMMLGDGASNGKYLSSTSKELIDEFQAIAHLIGKSASQNIHYKEGSRGKRKTAYRVTLSDKIEPEMKRNSLKKVDYNGRVFCFSTYTGFFVTRRNGKIAIQGNTLRSETSVLAAANPKFGRFDPYQAIAQQIDLPPTLINRFDVIFPLRDLPDRKKDELIATHVLHAHQSKGEDMVVPRDLFRKYVAYAKQRIKPELSNEAIEEIKKFYVDLRNMPVSSEGALRPIPISARQLQALIRMSEASAKMRLSHHVTIEDAKRAIDIMKYYLMQVGYDYESKTFDIDKGTGGMPTSLRSKVFLVRDTIIKLESRMGKMIPIEEIEKELEGRLTRDEINEAIIKLDSSGDTYRPKIGYVSRT